MGNIRGWGGPLGAVRWLGSCLITRYVCLLWVVVVLLARAYTTQWWRNATAALQKQILQRQRELGMYSVLPCFAGHIPGAIQRLYPQANITRSADWNKFPSPCVGLCGVGVLWPWLVRVSPNSIGHRYGSDYLLEPNDPLFQKIADKFMEVQAKEFGTSEWYNCDMFNEMNPSSDDPGLCGWVGW